MMMTTVVMEEADGRGGLWPSLTQHGTEALSSRRGCLHP